MKTIEIYETGETVFIKAKVAKVIFDKDKIMYELNDYSTGQRFGYRFTAKDMMPYTPEESE